MATTAYVNGKTTDMATITYVDSKNTSMTTYVNSKTSDIATKAYVNPRIGFAVDNVWVANWTGPGTNLGKPDGNQPSWRSTLSLGAPQKIYYKITIPNTVTGNHNFFLRLSNWDYGDYYGYHSLDNALTAWTQQNGFFLFTGMSEGATTLSNGQQPYNRQIVGEITLWSHTNNAGSATDSGNKTIRMTSTTTQFGNNYIQRWTAVGNLMKWFPYPVSRWRDWYDDGYTGEEQDGRPQIQYAFFSPTIPTYSVLCETSMDRGRLQ
jgi:hypothetical protein